MPVRIGNRTYSDERAGVAPPFEEKYANYLRQQGWTDEQKIADEVRQASVSLDKPREFERAQFFNMSRVPGINWDAFNKAVAQGYGGFGYAPTSRIIDQRRGD